ncbi:MAG: hypothetical protein PHR64_03355 [Candidatus Shapirobacteria bacterium]|nr:hypothetical protein [Candidatus Shapirobacteria bacterium]MDD5481947.1 hypothetical protein [Candidatus Shapirobacteria bacterium]
MFSQGKLGISGANRFFDKLVRIIFRTWLLGILGTIATIVYVLGIRKELFSETPNVFGEPRWFLALLVHLIPSYILIIIIIVAWKHERIGGFLFFLVAAFLMVLSDFGAPVIFLPAFIIGALFLVEGYLLRGRRK